MEKLRKPTINRNMSHLTIEEQKRVDEMKRRLEIQYAHTLHGKPTLDMIEQMAVTAALFCNESGVEK